MDLVVVGSIPTRHPGCKINFLHLFCLRQFCQNAPVAHLDRAPDFESGGRRFESSQTHLNFNAKQTVYKRAVCFLFNWNLRGFEAEGVAWKMRAVRSILQVNCQGWQFSARRCRRGSSQEVNDRRGESSHTQDVSLCFINRPPQNSKNTVNNVDVNNFKKILNKIHQTPIFKENDHNLKSSFQEFCDGRINKRIRNSSVRRRESS